MVVIIYGGINLNVFTSYFAKLKNIPNNIVPISIVIKRPELYDEIEYKKLAPKWLFLKEWKKNQDNEYYIKHFKKEVLDVLDPKKVVEELQKLSNNKGVVLVCYESPEKFCHRHIVAKWLNDNLNLNKRFYLQ